MVWVLDGSATLAIAIQELLFLIPLRKNSFRPSVAARVTQHTEQMINAWRRTKMWQRLYWVILTVVCLGFIGRFFWHYDSWPFSLVLVVALILNGAGTTRGRTTGHPQENDPNRR